MTGSLIPLPFFKDWDSSGNPLAFGTVATYEAGTSIPIATYTSAALSQVNTNPIVLNNRGEAQIWLNPSGGNIKIVVQDNANNQIRIVDNIPPPALLPIDSINVRYDQTNAEIAAGVTPTNYAIPSHDGCGFILLQRYGGAESASAATNNTAFANAVLVAGQIDGVIGITCDGGTWNFTAPWVLSGSGQAMFCNGPPVGGAAAQGCRVVGFGCPVISFTSLGGTTDCVTLGGSQIPQIELRNLQINCNTTGRDGVVVLGSNKPIIENLLVSNTVQDGLALTPSNNNFIEKLRVSHVSFASVGRHAVRVGLSGSGSYAAYVNEGTWEHIELRGNSVVTAGGLFMYMTAAGTPGSGAKISNHVFLDCNLDCIYRGTGNIPSPNVWLTDSATVQNFVILGGGSESTGGVNPGGGSGGYRCAVTGSGAWGGLQAYGNLTNSFWGNGLNGVQDSPAIAQRTDNSFSFAFSALMQAIVTGGTTSGASTAADYAAVRTGTPTSPGPLPGQAASWRSGNSTSNTSVEIQEWNGQVIVYTGGTSANGTAGLTVAASFPTAGGIRLMGYTAQYSGTGVPSSGLGANGDIYWRNDTPGTANQRLYVKASGAWAGIL
jgi:hypothetical protein